MSPSRAMTVTERLLNRPSRWDTEPRSSTAALPCDHTNRDGADGGDAARTTNHLPRADEHAQQQYAARDERHEPQTFASNTSSRSSSPMQNIRVPAPPTAYDLRGYDHYIFKKYMRRSSRKRFFHGFNGKVAPSRYGSEQRHDLGLCFATFVTRWRCEMGLKCPWRHHPLSDAERAWILDCGDDRGRDFTESVDKWWAFPEIPVPGTNMYRVRDD